MKKTILFLMLCVCLSSFIPLAAETEITKIEAANTESFKDNEPLMQGLKAYREEDWNTALFFLRKALAKPENQNQETWYVLCMAELFAEDYFGATKDCSAFITKYPKSKYIPEVTYHYNRALFNIGKYTEAINGFYDFCKKWSNHELYSSALFWIGESLYQSYKFEDSKSFFQEIITLYPNSPKYVEAVFRLELLEQRQREEKLLYLLRVTGEEYLSAREEYERKLRQYENEENLLDRDQARIVAQTNTELTAQLSDLNTKLTELENENAELRKTAEDALLAVRAAMGSASKEPVNIGGQSDYDILMKKAEQLQKLLHSEAAGY
jgi:TolA-binding protein